MNCLICEKKFIQKVHNQFLCEDLQCKHKNLSMLQHKYRKTKPARYGNCKICGIVFKRFGSTVTCSQECKRKNVDNTKLKYYIEKVMPTLEYKPKPSLEEQEIKRKEYEKNYNNTPERKEFMKNYRTSPENREKEKLAGVSYKERNPEVGKNGHLKRNYKISLDEYNQMLLDQDLVCAICKKEEVSVDSKKGKIRDLAVDHCHTTGKVRGLLCWKCNTSLGKFKDSVENLQRAIDYLNKSREVNTLTLTNPSIHDTINDLEN